MKLIRSILSSSPKNALPLLLATICFIGGAGCASHRDVSRPTGMPVTYDPAIRRDAGVLNEPSNSGNTPQDLSPFTPHWGDTRPGF